MSGDHRAAGVREGDILAGRYKIDKILGVGGMGVVVAAHHVQLDERVALKFLLPETLANQEAVSRFSREARAAVKIKSEHVARVSDVGTLENGAPYMVMEFLQGEDLSSWLQRGPLKIEQAVEFVLQACEAIAEAHSLGIVHRDIKPANLFVTQRPDGFLSVKVLDFGISKVTNFGSGGDGAMTKTGSMMGSPLYMSPEQMRGAKNVDARSDIWALGVVLYELLAGTTPFDGDSIPELALKVTTSDPTPLKTLRPDAPNALQAVIFRCLEKDAKKRFSTIHELATALLPFASAHSKLSVDRIAGIMRKSGASETILESPVSARAAQSSTDVSWGRTGKGISGSLIFGITLSTLVIVAGGAYVWRVKGRTADHGSTEERAAVAPPVVTNADPPAAPAETPKPAPVHSAEPALALTPSIAPPQPSAAPATPVRPSTSRPASPHAVTARPAAAPSTKAAGKNLNALMDDRL